jgi:hypothetical protein
MSIDQSFGEEMVLIRMNVWAHIYKNSYLGRVTPSSAQSQSPWCGPVNYDDFFGTLEDQ